MTSDSLEELQQRLLRDESVREMIRARAYEIFLMRGVQGGGAAHDWFQAESEVLAFLLANHYTTEKEMEQVAATPAATSILEPTAAPVAEPVAPKKRKPRSTAKATPAKQPGTNQTGAKKSVKSKSKPKRSRKESKSEDKPS